jgi:hypothetical protein
LTIRAISGSSVVMNGIFRLDRAITSKHLALLAAVVVVALLVVARRRILFE